MMGARHHGSPPDLAAPTVYGGATVVEGSMTQGAGQGPVRTETLRDFRVPPYAQQAPAPSPEEPAARPEPMAPAFHQEPHQEAPVAPEARRAPRAASGARRGRPSG